MKATDGAKSWSETGEGLRGFNPHLLLFDPHRRALLAVGDEGRTLLSSDEGRTWHATK